MKNNNLLIVLILMILSFTSCEKRDVDDVKNLTETKLMSTLEKLGYSISKDGQSVIVNDKVLETKELDLSDQQLNSIAGLDVFTALEILNLNNNNLKDLKNAEGQNILNNFKNITVLDITKNNLKHLDITGLKKLESLTLQANDSLENIIGLNAINNSNLRKLYLPKKTKYNRNEILSFYLAHKDYDMKIESTEGMIKYTSKRDIPDPLFKEFLIKKYPEVFDNDGLLDLSKKFDITEENEKSKTDWSRSTEDMPAWMLTRFFNAKGIKSMEGIQYFKNNVIKCLHIFNAEFEQLDISNDTIIESFGIGNNQKSLFDYEQSINKNVKKINVKNCTKLKELIVSGLINEINLKGCKSLEILCFNEHVEKLDLTECPNILNISTLNNVELEHHKLKEIVFPKKEDMKGLKGLVLMNTEIKELDLDIKEDSFFGTALILERNINLKKIKVALKLGNGTSFRDSFFEEVDFIGSKCWNTNSLEWIDTSFVSSWFINNPNLKIVNGEPYDADDF